MNAAGEPFQENPFCTRRTRPGAIDFIFPPGVDLPTLLDRFRNAQWRGAIVGPHGSGKSALLAAMVPALAQLGRRPLWIELHDGQRRLPIDLDAYDQPGLVVVVDGYEQLGRLSRWRLLWRCRRHGWGLLVTSHAPVGLPELITTATDLPLAEMLVARLAAGAARAVDPAEVAAAFARQRGNLREVLFDLYDVYEAGEAD